jgi:hypothetical protein
MARNFENFWVSWSCLHDASLIRVDFASNDARLTFGDFDPDALEERATFAFSGVSNLKISSQEKYDLFVRLEDSEIRDAILERTEQGNRAIVFHLALDDYSTKTSSHLRLKFEYQDVSEVTSA